ncbi:hypothetical protein NVV93_09105 [Pseudomonas sp. LS44]|nr:hypothetical protein [Pseudomonas sp. LS44]UVE19509.1 hypothetical protein NVV93_09105 [Pseudomonas sp. LS44]
MLSRIGVLDGFYGQPIVYEFFVGVLIGVIYRRGWIREGLWLPVLVLIG